VVDPNAELQLATDRARSRQSAAGSANRQDRSVADALGEASLFSLCTKKELKLVAKLAKTREIREGTTLVTEGESGETMFVFLSGGATVHKAGRKIADIKSGEVVGELAVLARAPRNATVKTTADSEVATIGRRELFRLIEDAPGFSRKLFESLANRIRDLDKKLVC
jgi:CRP-like cAMP-binding protein